MRLQTWQHSGAEDIKSRVADNWPEFTPRDFNEAGKSDCGLRGCHDVPLENIGDVPVESAQESGFLSSMWHIIAQVVPRLEGLFRFCERRRNFSQQVAADDLVDRMRLADDDHHNQFSPRHLRDSKSNRQIDEQVASSEADEKPFSYSSGRVGFDDAKQADENVVHESLNSALRSQRQQTQNLQEQEGLERLMEFALEVDQDEAREALEVSCGDVGKAINFILDQRENKTEQSLLPLIELGVERDVCREALQICKGVVETAADFLLHQWEQQKQEAEMRERIGSSRDSLRNKEQENVAILIGLGFGQDESLQALRTNGNDVEKAANHLLQHQQGREQPRKAHAALQEREQAQRQEFETRLCEATNLSREECRVALHKAGGNHKLAADMLFGSKPIPVSFEIRDYL